MGQGVIFSQAAAKRIAEVVKRVEGQGQDRTGGPIRPHPTDTTFWAMIIGGSIDGHHFNFIRIYPDASEDTSGSFVVSNGISYRILGTDPEAGIAREANGVKSIPTYTVVQMAFIGYDKDKLPAFLFNYGNPDINPADLRPHDHRDNLNGGFAFATYHPGTSLPQQPWAV